MQEVITHGPLSDCQSMSEQLQLFGHLSDIPFKITIEIINNTRGVIAILTSGKKRNAVIGEQIQVPDAYSCSRPLVRRSGTNEKMTCKLFAFFIAFTGLKTQ
jgi:hypothetical protein